MYKRFYLDEKNDSRQWPCQGDMIVITNSSSPEIEIQIAEEQGSNEEKVTLRRGGVHYFDKPLDKVWLTWKQQAGGWIEFVVTNRGPIPSVGVDTGLKRLRQGTHKTFSAEIVTSGSVMIYTVPVGKEFIIDHVACLANTVSPWGFMKIILLAKPSYVGDLELKIWEFHSQQNRVRAKHYEGIVMHAGSIIQYSSQCNASVKITYVIHGLEVDAE